VCEESVAVKRFSKEEDNDRTLVKEAPANFVPAAAVIQKVQVLFRLIGRKGRVGC
jgi:hypothetical protein